jgi:uroporphyrinogen-III synthase
MKLLVVRPQPGADATAARITAAGHEPLLMPLFAVQPVNWDAPSAADYDGLLLTSANAVREAGTQLAFFAHLPVYAVGMVTAAAAEQAGLRVGHIGNNGADELLSERRNCRLLWLAGEDHSRFDIDASVEIDLRIVYRSAALPVPYNFREMTLQADHVLLHSARAADRFASVIGQQALDRADISIAALSEKIAIAAGEGWRSRRVATHPTDAALLSCL